MELIKNEKTREVYQEIIDNEYNIKFEVLVDENEIGRIIVNKNNVIRVILVYNQYVYNDIINDIRTRKDKLGFGKKYISVDKEYYDDGQKLLSEYLNVEPNFYSDRGELFRDEYPTNQEIIDFLVKNKELVASLLEQNKTIKKKYINRKY